ncbi:MAG: peptide deformylase [Candidatus Saccharibacteria bacterium]
MAIKDILQIGDPSLKNKNKTINNSDKKVISKLIKDLTDTMLKNDIIGIAAPQIGENYKMFITEPRQTAYRTVDQSDKLRVYINPKIIEYSKETTNAYEGCGSVSAANFFGPVKRSKEITIEAYDQDFNKFRLQCDGLLSIVIQHEYDHLSGIEFIEKISDYKKAVNFYNYDKYIRTSPTQKSAYTITKLNVTQL